MTAALWAAFNGNIPLLELLVAKNANLNIRTEEGYSALLLAINELKFDMMHYLIGCEGCDVEVSHDVSKHIYYIILGSSGVVVE